MTLALIIGMWAALGSAPRGEVAVQAMAAQAAPQETQPQQDSPPAAVPQEPAQPEEHGKEESKTDSSVPQTTTPPRTESAQPEPAVDKPESKPASPAPAKSSTTKSKKKSSHKPAAAPQTGADPGKVVVRNGSTADPTVQITPRLSQQQASHQLQKTDQLLTTTDANLKKISGRPLNRSQQDTVTQVRKYMEQAKAAVDAGDLERAHNLAVKAQLLSSELIKQQ